MSPNQAIPTDKLIRFFPLAAAQPSTILSWPEALDASGFRRACRMGISRNACSLLIRTQLAESVLELQLPGHIVQKPVDLGDEILWDRGLPTQLDPYLNLQVVSHRRCADLTDLVGKVLNLVRLEVSGGDVNARRRWWRGRRWGRGLPRQFQLHLARTADIANPRTRIRCPLH